MAYFMRTGCNTFAQMCQGANGLVWLGDDGQNKAVVVDEIANARIFSADMRRNIVENTLLCRMAEHTAPSLEAGWISPDGIFFPVQTGHHRDFYTCVLKRDVHDMVGWISVHEDIWAMFKSSKDKTATPNAAQRETLTRIGRSPDDKNAVSSFRNIDFNTAVPDWAAQIVRMDADKPKIEAVITGAHELNADEKADLVLKLRLAQPRMHNMAIAGMGATTPPPALRARFP